MFKPNSHLNDELAPTQVPALADERVQWLFFFLGLLNLDQAADGVDLESVVGRSLLHLDEMHVQQLPGTWRHSSTT